MTENNRPDILANVISEVEKIVSHIDTILQFETCIEPSDYERHYIYLVQLTTTVQAEAHWRIRDPVYHFLESNPRRILDRLLTRLIRRTDRLDFYNRDKNWTTLMQTKFELEAVQLITTKVLSFIECQTTAMNPSMP